MELDPTRGATLESERHPVVPDTWPHGAAGTVDAAMVRSMGTSFFANLMNALMGGEQPRTYSEDDFARWFSTLKLRSQWP